MLWPGSNCRHAARHAHRRPGLVRARDHGLARPLGTPPGHPARPVAARMPSRAAEDIAHALRSYDRAPFRFVVAELLSCSPTPEAFCAFPDAHPDRWASAIKSLAPLAGFHERLEIDHNLNLEITTKSDAELHLFLELHRAQVLELLVPLSEPEEGEFTLLEG